jgi:hypothetical protein
VYGKRRIGDKTLHAVPITAEEREQLEETGDSEWDSEKEEDARDAKEELTNLDAVSAK